MERRTFLAGLGAAALAPAGPTWAQPAWPNGPVRLVTPTPVGVGIDAFARVYADQLSKVLRVPVVVENRAGAAGTLGTDAVAKAQANGQTLLVSTALPFTAAPHLFARLPYQPHKDLVPVAQLYQGGSFLVAHPTLQAQTLPAFVALARQRPKAINYASHGPGSTAHLFMEQLQDAAGIELQHIPYRQSFMPDLLAGQVDLAWEPPNSALPHIRAGKLMALAYSGARRSQVLPQVPTLAETYPGLQFNVWVGVWAPAGTPPDTVARLHAALLAVTASPEVDRLILEVGAEPMATPQPAIAAAIEREARETGALIRAKNIRLD